MACTILGLVDSGCPAQLSAIANDLNWAARGLWKYLKAPAMAVPERLAEVPLPDVAAPVDVRDRND